MPSSQVVSQLPLDKMNPDFSMSRALTQAEIQCKGCQVSSPMICVERCDVWRVKNEIFSVKQVTGEKGHLQQLLNAVKNCRRIEILNALCEQSRSLKSLQKYLKQEGFVHSLTTITIAYVRPLVAAGLVLETGARYKVSFYGRKISELLQEFGREAPLPIHSCCYEETILRELVNRPRSFEELATLVPQKGLSRILLRLRKKGLLYERLDREYVFYHRIKGKPKVALSPTEKKIFNIIPTEGTSARQLAKEAKITLRRTYKYLRRLREKKLAFALKKPRTYVLTVQGKEIAALLGEVSRLAASTAMLAQQISHANLANPKTLLSKHVVSTLK